MVGIGWGLPSRSIDPFLFGEDEPWPGEKIYRLSGAGAKFSPERGADVDPDPLQRLSPEPVPLTETDEQLARIYLRYRLYTYQPDEMITMMALAGMNPRRLDLDPRLYQYGGLFIYPVGGLIGLFDLLGMIDLRGDVVYYLDNPEEFGKFYIVARGYAAAWGLLGVVVVFGIARRLGGVRTGLIAALVFTLMPVVICMSHEGKPHLPGAALMLLAVLFAMRHLAAASPLSEGGLRGVTSPATKPVPKGVASRHANLPQPLLVKEEGSGQSTATTPPSSDPRSSNRNWWLMCICCGAALGMVLSSLPIFVLIPLVAWLDYRAPRRATSQSPDRKGGDTDENTAQWKLDSKDGDLVLFILRRTLLGGLIAACVYLVTNPYILINAVINRDVLASNFGNSLAMYDVARVVEGFVRVLELTMEGATLPILLIGMVALVVAITRRNRAMVPLAVTALVFFAQFILIGAGKPGEYGRFGIYTNAALAIGTACLLGAKWPSRNLTQIKPLLLGVIILWVGWCGGGYLSNFRKDCTEEASRLRIRRASPLGPWSDGDSDPWLRELGTVFLTAEPAPYGCPPLPFHKLDVRLVRGVEAAKSACSSRSDHSVSLMAVDRTELGPWGPPGVVAPARPRILPEFHYPAWWITRRQTPISWANKPFEIWSAGVPFAP